MNYLMYVVGIDVVGYEIVDNHPVKPNCLIILMMLIQSGYELVDQDLFLRFGAKRFNF